MKTYILILLIFLDVAFAASIKQPLDTQKYYYAIGQGVTESKAKEAALALISENIKVSVSSSFELSSKVVSQGDDSINISETKSDISSKSNTIHFSNVKVLEKREENSLYTLLVQVDRELLFADYKLELENLDLDLAEEFEAYKKANRLTKLSISVAIEDKIEELESLLVILHAINTEFNSTKNTTKYRNYKEQIKKDFQNVSFSFKSDKNSRALALLLEKYLNAKGISTNKQNRDFIIDITTKAKKRKYASTNERFAQLTFALRITTINIINKESELEHTTIRKTKEASSKGFKDAIYKTAKYKKILNQIGVISFLLN